MFLLFVSFFHVFILAEGNVPYYVVDCSTLRMGQYMCPDPDYIPNLVDPKTQQIRGCTQENKARSK